MPSTSFTTYKQLGGKTVSIEQIIDEVKVLPLDGVLGFLGSLSIELVQAGQNFGDPRGIQGQNLNYAIVDEFPYKLPNVHKMYIPGRVPVTGGHHLFLHEQNIAWLTHLALLHADRDCTTPELNYDLRKRICRLLLIANDFLNFHDDKKVNNLTDRRGFVLNWLRHWQFNQYFEHVTSTMMRLSRQWILLNEFLPKYYDIETDFIEATNGVCLKRFFEILAVFITHFHNLKPGTHWLSKEKMCSTIKANKNEIEIITDKWSVTPDQYIIAYDEWNNSRPVKDGNIPYFDYVTLRNTPLIEARSGELICPVLPFLLAKIVDGAFFILTDFLNNKDAIKRNKFHQSLGNAYQDYAHKLIEFIGYHDNKGKWEIEFSPKSKSKNVLIELSDSYLQRGDIAISFEHKGLRPDTEYLRGGNGNKILGPDEEVLNKLDSNTSVSYEEGSKNDEGLLTRGLWQQAKAGKSLISWAEEKFQVRPKIIIPIITNLAHLRVDEVTRGIYLNPLIEKTKMYSYDFWSKPQWIYIGDLEKLAAIAEEGILDIEKLLTEKNSVYPDMQFDVFLYQYFKKKNYTLNKLFDTATNFLNDAKGSFWPSL